MPRRRTRTKARYQRDRLTVGQHFELIAQCGAEPRHFVNEVERRAAWLDHRADLLSSCYPGRRPAAWWVYDAPAQPAVVRVGYILPSRSHPAGYPVPVREHEVEALLRLGLATAADLAQLRQAVTYRRDFLGLTDDQDTARQAALLDRVG